MNSLLKRRPQNKRFLDFGYSCFKRISNELNELNDYICIYIVYSNGLCLIYFMSYVQQYTISCGYLIAQFNSIEVIISSSSSSLIFFSFSLEKCVAFGIARNFEFENKCDLIAFRISMLMDRMKHTANHYQAPMAITIKRVLQCILRYSSIVCLFLSAFFFFLIEKGNRFGTEYIVVRLATNLFKMNHFP